MSPNTQKLGLVTVQRMLIEDPRSASRIAAGKDSAVIVVEREVVDVRLTLVAFQVRDGLWACDPVGVFAVAGFVVAVVAQPECRFGGLFDVVGGEFLGFFICQNRVDGVRWVSGLLVSFFWLVLHSQSFGGKPWIVEGRSVGGDLDTRLSSASEAGVGAAETMDVRARRWKRAVICMVI